MLAAKRRSSEAGAVDAPDHRRPDRHFRSSLITDKGALLKVLPSVEQELLCIEEIVKVKAECL